MPKFLCSANGHLALHDHKLSSGIILLIIAFTLQIAEQKMYEHWKQNAPELREVRKGQKKQKVEHLQVTESK